MWLVGGGADVSTGVIAMTSWGFYLRHNPHSDWCRSFTSSNGPSIIFSNEIDPLNKNSSRIFYLFNGVFPSFGYLSATDRLIVGNQASWCNMASFLCRKRLELKLNPFKSRFSYKLAIWTVFTSVNSIHRLVFVIVPQCVFWDKGWICNVLLTWISYQMFYITKHKINLICSLHKEPFQSQA